MKFLLQTNVVMQALWILALLCAIVEPIYILYIAFFMGINHMVFSLILLIAKGRKSHLLQHLIWSSVYLTLFITYVSVGRSVTNVELSEDLFQILASVPPILLALSYWYVSFVKLNPFKKTEHNVFDI